jgi:dihydrofolate reductase
MRRLRHISFMSLDGYVAGPNGEFDWIPLDPDMDFMEALNGIDTVVMGRKTFEEVYSRHRYEGGAHPGPGPQKVVVSRTLRASAYPHVTMINDNVAEAIAALKAKPGKDIWLFGGSNLFHSFLDMDLVDSVHVAVVPLLLGGGRPLLPAPADRALLTLERQHVYEKSGIVSLEYSVKKRHGRAAA